MRCARGVFQVKLAVRCEMTDDGWADTDDTVCIKMLLKTCIRRRVTVRNQRVKENPWVEIKVMQYLSDPGHSHILNLRQLFDNDDMVFMVMDFSPDGELFNYVVSQPGGRLPEAQAKDFFVQLIKAVCYMHGRGIVHRDMSLENVLLGPENRLRVIDFGLAADRWSRPPCQQIDPDRVGKTGYMSPECYANLPIDERSDLWCLGVMLFMMLFGVPPYRYPDGHICPLFRELAAGNMPVLLEHWGLRYRVSPDALNLVLAMLMPPVEERLSIPDILRHPWLADALDDLGGQEAAAAQAAEVLEAGREMHAFIWKRPNDPAAGGGGGEAEADAEGETEGEVELPPAEGDAEDDDV